MRVLFTSMNERGVLGVCELLSGRVTTIPTPRAIDGHRPFGITWDDDKLYLAQPTSVLVFDRDLNYEGVLLEGMWFGTHQILYSGGLLWMVSPRLNAVARYDMKSRTDYFFPQEERVGPLPARFHGKCRLSYSEDANHYNCIHISDGIYLSAHNHNRPSFVKRFTPGLKLSRHWPRLGKQIHNVLPDGENVITVDSLGSQSVVSTGKWAVKVGGGFVRGLAATPEYMVTCRFPYDPSRTGRREGDSTLCVIDRKAKKVVQEVTLKGVGNVNDLRLADCFDECHGRPPLWEMAKIL